MVNNVSDAQWQAAENSVIVKIQSGLGDQKLYTLQVTGGSQFFTPREMLTEIRGRTYIGAQIARIFPL